MQDSNGNSDYVCPKCKAALVDLRCTRCGEQYNQRDHVFNFLPRGSGFEEAEASSANYDTIYTDHEAVWEDQGRGPNFRSYFASLLRDLSTGVVLEIGCGEGYALEPVSAARKWATDISPVALTHAWKRTGASCAAAVAEKLPYPDASMDLVFSIGVMEHFLDVGAAHSEILRVLRPQGHYVALIHVKMTRGQRLQQKAREFLLPPRPVKLARWLRKKLVKPVHQIARNLYTLESARDKLEADGLRVQSTITSASVPKPPLAGSHVAIYVCRRR